MSIQVTGTLTPFGKPITKALIRVTSLTNEGTVIGVYLNTYTDALGVYDFELIEGAYLVEYKQKDVLVEVGNIYVTENTPTPVDLISLLNTAPLVSLPSVPSPDVDWETELTLHDQAASKTFDVNQAVKDDAYSLDYEEASSTTSSTLGRSVDEVMSLNGGIKSEEYSFSKEGNTLVYSAKGLITPNISYSNVFTLAEDTEVAIDRNDLLNVGGLQISNSLTHEKKLTEYVTTDNRSIQSDFGYQTEESRFTQTDLQKVIETSKEKTFGITEENYSATFVSKDSVTSEYRDPDTNLMVEQPKITKSELSKIEGGTNFTEVEVGTEQRITGDDNSYGRWFKKLTTYSKIAIDELINTGFESIKRYTVDKFQISDLFEADTVNKKIRVKGQLIVDNPEDFMGEVRFQVFQYSVDGQTDWHDEFTIDDLWRRHNESVDGYVDPTKWSVPYLLQAQDGEKGDTLYFEYQYSTDKLSWHDTFMDTDIWRRERIIENDFPITEWTLPARIKGADGIDGTTQIIEYQYSIDGLDPWHSNFMTGDHYRRERLILNGVAGEWSTPAKLVPEKDVDYADGYDGAGMYWIQKPDTWFPVNWALAYEDFYDRFGKYPVDQDHLTYTNDPNNSKDATKSDTARWEATTSSWVEPAMIVNGDMLVKGTVTAEHIKAKSLSGGEISSETTIVAGSGVTTAGMNGDDSGLATNNRYKDARFWAGAEYPNESDGTPSAPFLVNKNGKMISNDALVRGRIDATEMVFPDDKGAIGELGLLQLSGGGYELDPADGWGIHSNGYAEFNGGLNVNGGTISGATIIGADIYSGNILYHVDYNTDGNVDDIRYLNHPDIPLAARSSYTSNTNYPLSSSSGAFSFSHKFNVLTCTERRGSPNSNRFRWGKIRSSAMRVTLSGTMRFLNFDFTIRMRLIAPDGTVLQTVTKNSNWMNAGFTLSVGNITFDISWVYNRPDMGVGGYVTSVTVSNRSGNFGTLNNNALNGSVEFYFYSSNAYAYTSGAKFVTSLNVDNSNFPA